MFRFVNLNVRLSFRAPFGNPPRSSLVLRRLSRGDWRYACPSDPASFSALIFSGVSFTTPLRWGRNVRANASALANFFSTRLLKLDGQQEP